MSLRGWIAIYKSQSFSLIVLIYKNLVRSENNINKHKPILCGLQSPILTLWPNILAIVHYAFFLQDTFRRWRNLLQNNTCSSNNTRQIPIYKRNIKKLKQTCLHNKLGFDRCLSLFDFLLRSENAEILSSKTSKN